MIYHTTDGSPCYGDDTPYGTFNDLGSAVERAVRTVEDRVHEFDVIVVQGISGMSIGFPLALKIDKPIAVVRKPSDDNHCGSDLVTGIGADDRGTRLTGKSCLFVDDFVSMGVTRNRVRTAVEAEGGTVVAQYMSREDDMLLL